MKRLSSACLLLAGIAWGETAIYVSKEGSDAADGSEARPFATLERARDEVRKHKAAGAVTVYVRAGEYALDRTFRLSAEDSGRADAPVVWRAYPGETVVLSGGTPIGGFQPYRGKILQTSVRGAPFRQLFYEDARQPLARYPDYDPENPYGGGWAYADGALIPMYRDIPGEDKHSLIYKEQDTRQWQHPEDGEVMVFPRYNWWNNIVRIKSIDRAARKITLAGECSYAIRPGDRYYVQGMFEELDAPGEWYLDTRAGTLYFWPPDGARDGVTVWAPRLTNVLEFGPGTAYITWRGFTIEHTSGTAVLLNQATHCLIAGNVIRNAGDYRGSGVVVNGGSHNGVAGNDIDSVGANGIALSGGDRITLTSAENYADNNYIHHTGVYYKQGVGIAMSGCGSRATHNLIHDTPRMAIIFSGNLFLIEYNHMRHTNLETADTGVVYTGGRDWLGSRGTVVRYNYMHDSIGYGFENGHWTSPHYSWGVYLDDNAGGVDVIGNIVVRAFRGLIHLHNGRDNLVENNIFVDGKLYQAEFNGWTADQRNWKTHLPTMIKGYESVQGQPAWQGMRGMETHPTQAVLPNGMIMSGNVFRRNIVYYSDAKARLFGSRNLPLDHNRWEENIYWNSAGPLIIARGAGLRDWDFDAWREAGADRGSLVADPLFVDPASDDYRLRPDSPAATIGFEPIPVEEIGPYEDELRASWPIREAEGAREHPSRTP